MIENAKSLRHQPLLPNKTSNHDIRYADVSATSVEGFFKFLKIFNFTTCCMYKKIKKGPK